MLRLTQVELLGFKSFPHKTVLELDGGVNCIVGPNGSGKSNVADAIMFAFGSQSARELRTSNLSGLIFAGTEQLRPLNLASVTLHFECTAAAPEKEAEAILSDYDPDSIEVPEAALPVSAGGSGIPGAHAGSKLWRHFGVETAKYQDPTPSVVKQLMHLKPGERVSLTRRVFRDGSGGYFLNGESVRLKDVDAFFDRYNMGRSAIFSVSQGEVERKILAGPQELREWLAEATGIALLLQQKDRAQLKLKRAQQNLDRLGDILHHTRSLVEDLSQQRKLAEAHQKFARQLRAVELNEIRREIEFAQRQLDSAGKAVVDLVQLTQEERLKLEQAQQAVDSLQRQWRACDSSLAQAEQMLDANRGEAERLKRESAVAMRSAEAAAEALAQARQDEHEASTHAGMLSQELAAAQGAFEGAREGIAELRGHAEAERSREEERRLALEHAAREQEAAADKALQLAQDIARLSNEREAILRHSEQVQGQIGAMARHNEASRERITALAQERDAEAIRYSEAADRAASLVEQLGQAKSALEEIAEQIKAKDESCSALKNQLAALRAKKKALEEIVQESQRQTSALHLLLNDVTLGGTLHRATEVTFPPHLRSAFMRLLAHLSEALVCPPGSEAAMLERISAESGDVLAIWSEEGVSVDSLHPDSLWRSISAPTQVLQALHALLGDVASAYDSEAARDMLRESPQLRSVVLLDGSAMMGRDHAWLGQPPAERARAVAKRSDVAELDAEITVMQDELGKASASLENLTALRTELQHQRDERAAELAGTQERLRANDEMLRRLNAQLVDREAELEILVKQGEQLAKDMQELTGSLPIVEARLEELGITQQHARERGRECAEARSAAESSLEAARKAHAEALTKRELAEQQLTHIEQQCMNLADQENNLRRRHQQLQSRIAALELERDASAHMASASGEQAEAISGELEAATARISELRAERARLAERTDSAQIAAATQAQTLSRMEQDAVAAEGQRDRSAERLEGWLHELRERFNLSLSALLADPSVTAAPPDAEMDASEAGRTKLREEKARLRSEIEAIGPVNILSITQHEEQSSRLSFLERQAQDLERAATDLRALVSSLDARTEEQYRANLDLIGQRFDSLYKDLFGGGWARLRFIPQTSQAAKGSAEAPEGGTDAGAVEGESTADPSGAAQHAGGNDTAPESIINAGVEVEVQLPGSRRHNLRSLSGGQRSLIFLSLFFAVHSARSPGFCILDEADAALDDANVGRFAGMIERVAQGSDDHPAEQFIVVTHNKRTMETGDKLVGVVGRPKGVSNLLDVNLRDAKKMADQPKPVAAG